jgi:hypothetical protein
LKSQANEIRRRSYRPERSLCPYCGQILKRSHIAWRKQIIYASGPEWVTSWAYRCPDPNCEGGQQSFISEAAETHHLKHHRYSRELIIKVGYRRFWHHRTVYELHDWLTQSLHLPISERQVLNLIGDFLALLRAGQQAKVRHHLAQMKTLVIGIDGMQPEKGNRILYIAREPRLGLTLLAESLDEGTQYDLSEQVLEPLKMLAEELGLRWQGVVSDAQVSIRLAVATSLPGTPHQACQAHCLRDAGKLTFEADRQMKKRLKSTFRQIIKRLRRRIETLPPDDPFRSVLLDYAEAIYSTLLTGGVAPFDLGGIAIFEALEAVAASLERCQKKAIIPSYSG